MLTGELSSRTSGPSGWNLASPRLLSDRHSHQIVSLVQGTATADRMITAQPIQIANSGDIVEGRLIFAGDALVAVLQCLEGGHYDQQGQWNLEAGFGPLADCEKVFPTVDAAIAWITERIASAT